MGIISSKFNKASSQRTRKSASTKGGFVKCPRCKSETNLADLDIHSRNSVDNEAKSKRRKRSSSVDDTLNARISADGSPRPKGVHTRHSNFPSTPQDDEVFLGDSNAPSVHIPGRGHLEYQQLRYKKNNSENGYFTNSRTQIHPPTHTDTRHRTYSASRSAEITYKQSIQGRYPQNYSTQPNRDPDPRGIPNGNRRTVPTQTLPYTQVDVANGGIMRQNYSAVNPNAQHHHGDRVSRGCMHPSSQNRSPSPRDPRPSAKQLATSVCQTTKLDTTLDPNFQAYVANHLYTQRSPKPDHTSLNRNAHYVNQTRPPTMTKPSVPVKEGQNPPPLPPKPKHIRMTVNKPGNLDTEVSELNTNYTNKPAEHNSGFGDRNRNTMSRNYSQPANERGQDRPNNGRYSQSHEASTADNNRSTLQTRRKSSLLEKRISKSCSSLNLKGLPTTTPYEWLSDVMTPPEVDGFQSREVFQHTLNLEPAQDTKRGTSSSQDQNDTDRIRQVAKPAENSENASRTRSGHSDALASFDSRNTSRGGDRVLPTSPTSERSLHETQSDRYNQSRMQSETMPKLPFTDPMEWREGEYINRLLGRESSHLRSADPCPSPGMGLRSLSLPNELDSCNEPSLPIYLRAHRAAAGGRSTTSTGRTSHRSDQRGQLERVIMPGPEARQPIIYQTYNSYVFVTDGSQVTLSGSRVTLSGSQVTLNTETPSDIHVGNPVTGYNTTHSQ